VKKVTLLSLVLVYLVLSIGIGKSTHFCLGREHHSSLFSFEATKCICSKYQTKKSCCKDETTLVKIADDQSINEIVSSVSPSLFLVAVFEAASVSVNFTLKEQKADSYLPPPPKIPIYQSVCSLVFYEGIA
jgi:hypothetical protein